METFFNEVAPMPGAPAPPEGEEIPMIEVRGAVRDMLKSFDPEEIPDETSTRVLQMRNTQVSGD